MADDRFILTPKDDATMTITVRIRAEMNDKLEELAKKSGRSRNEIIKLALEFALGNVEFIDNKNIAEK